MPVPTKYEANNAVNISLQQSTGDNILRQNRFINLDGNGKLSGSDLRLTKADRNDNAKVVTELADSSIVSHNIDKKMCNDPYEYQETVIGKSSTKNGNEYNSNLLVTQTKADLRTDLMKNDQDLKNAHDISDKVNDRLEHRDDVVDQSLTKINNDDANSRAEIETKSSLATDVKKKYHKIESSYSDRQLHRNKNIVDPDDGLISSMHNLMNSNNSRDDNFENLATTDVRLHGNRKYDLHKSLNKYQPKNQNLGVDIKDLNDYNSDNSEKGTLFDDNYDSEVIYIHKDRYTG